ncbi:MAG: multidrug effflux MFS transporter [Cardiobacteriaceae bacterium]|nr:multidrug effflux MFS transporter [Cardiobacteriaceae bacterium]
MLKKLVEKHQNFILIWILAFMSALAPLATDMYLPSLKIIQQDMATEEHLMQLSITVFFVAFACGQLLYGPISDAYGRRKPLYLGIVLYTVASLACGLVNSVYAFIFWRFIQALGGCSGVVIARAIINDKYDVKQGAAILAIMMMISSLAPMLAPTLGGLITVYTKWQFIFYLLFIFGLMLLAMMLIGLPETAKVDTSLKFDAISVMKNYLSITKDRRYMIFVLSFSCTLASIFAYITAASSVFQNSYGLSPQAFGIIFGINTIGSTVTSICNAKLVKSHSPYNILQISFVVMFIFASLLIASALLNWGLLAFEVFLFLTMSMIGLIAPNTTVLAMARFNCKSGAASGLLGMIQFAIAGFVSFLVGFLHASSPTGMAVVMAVCVLCGWCIYLLINRRTIQKFFRKLHLA